VRRAGGGIVKGARVLLVNPRIASRGRARFPLSLLNVASTLAEHGHTAQIVDGNVDDGVAGTRAALDAGRFDAVGITVMGGPQVATALAASRAVREIRPDLPIVWGGYFPSLYPEAALAEPDVDFLARDQGENTLLGLLNALPAADAGALRHVPGLTWRDGIRIVTNPAPKLLAPERAARLPYELLGEPRKYLARTFMGRRTAVHQAALGCRFRCTFCGVAAMFRGRTLLPPHERFEHELTHLRDAFGADSVQYFDHNFFDREADMVPLLEVMSKMQMPWWCYARADALVNLSRESWALVRKSGLRMAYIGAETPNNQLLKAIRKGTHADQTLEVAELCRANGVIPELSFMVAPPDDPEGETERTFDFIRRVKRVNPAAEIIVYVYTPLPASSVPDAQRLGLGALRDVHGELVIFPRTAQEWTRPEWVAYACHADAPWMSDRLRRRVRDFVTVLRCRFPTVQDTRAPRWARIGLRALASWRYAMRRYDRPWELNASQRAIDLIDPRVTSI
jgi:anaerobic magnesium-protoporphyrin IX monomethyl ester cyclase